MENAQQDLFFGSRIVEMCWRFCARTILAYPAAVVRLKHPIRERPEIRNEFWQMNIPVIFLVSAKIPSHCRKEIPSSNMRNNQMELCRIRDGNFVVILFLSEQF